MSEEQDTTQDVDRFTVVAFRLGLAAGVLGLLLLLVTFVAALLAIWTDRDAWVGTSMLCAGTGGLLVTVACIGFAERGRS